MPDFSEIESAWRLLRLEVEAVRNYHKAFLIIGLATGREPMLEILLPRVLLVLATVVLDDALTVALEGERERFTLKARIDMAASRGLLSEPDAVHRVRESRNRAAHESVDFDGLAVTWSDLDEALDVIGRALVDLGAPAYERHLEWFGERTRSAASRPGIAMEQILRYGVKEDGDEALLFTAVREVRTLSG